jgi:hypothetical protein
MVTPSRVSAAHTFKNEVANWITTLPVRISSYIEAGLTGSPQGIKLLKDARANNERARKQS